MSLSDNNNNNNKDKPPVATTIHVLALHGSEGSAQEFQGKIVKELADKAGSSSSVRDKQTWHVTAVNAPFVKGNGFAWWLNAPGVRSYNAVEYPGIDESIAAVTQALAKQPRVDLIVAHSQGAILTVAMLAQGILSNGDKNKNNHHHHHPPPRLGYILNGGAWPNPYTAQLESLQLGNINVRVCAITGQADTINPPETQQRVTEALSRAGATVTTITHSGGHSVPVQNDNVVQQVLEWVAEGDTFAGSSSSGSGSGNGTSAEA